MEEQQIRKFDGIDWAIVEVMGHQTYAGQISQVVLGSVVMVRVDVPETETPVYGSRKRKKEKRPAFTKLIGAASLYGITPCDEGAAREAARLIGSSPVTVVSLSTSRQLSSGEDED